MTHISPHPPESQPNEQERKSPADPGQERRRHRLTRWLGHAAVIVPGALIGVGAWSHVQRQAETIATLTDERNAVPVVRTAVLQRLDAPRRIDLPGSTQAFDTATLFARATG